MQSIDTIQFILERARRNAETGSSCAWVVNLNVDFRVSWVDAQAAGDGAPRRRDRIAMKAPLRKGVEGYVVSDRY